MTRPLNPSLHERLSALRITMGHAGRRGSNDYRPEGRVLLSYDLDFGVVGSLSISLSEFDKMVDALKPATETP